jgi:hypothetical protein
MDFKWVTYQILEGLNWLNSNPITDPCNRGKELSYFVTGEEFIEQVNNY